MSKKISIGPYSAYAIAVKYGYEGTEEQWVKEQEASRVSAQKSAEQAADSLQSLKDGIAAGDFKGEKGDKGDTGPQGIQGERGPQGEQGLKGDTGEIGPAATVAIGAVIGLDAGSAPTVTNSGDEHNAVLNFGIPTASAIDLAINVLFKLSRTGKVYTVKIPKFASNQAITCEKLDDNAGLVCESSTDTVEGQDDYADIPLFKWYNCNYKRDASGHAYPTAIEGLNDDYTTTGSVDIGVIQMTPFVKWDDSNPNYVLLSITDTPRDGYTAWCTARANDQIYPYVIHSKCISGIASDGLPRSQFGLKPVRNQSYNSIITDYAKKGAGYRGAGAERNTWKIMFDLIKFAKKSSQAVSAGCTSYSLQYSASIQRSEKLTYFPVTKAQAANIVVGSYVSVGYGSNNNGAVNNDRGIATIHKYADGVKVLKIEPIDDANSAVYLDCDGFDTMPVALTSTLNAPITLTSMHWYGGTTNSVIGHHDGSPVSNTNGKFPCRTQGIEYAVGGYTVASDTVIVFTDNYEKDVYVAPLDSVHSSNDAVIKSTYTNVGHIAPSGDWWIGDIGFDVNTGATWPSAKGSGDNTGVGDMLYGGGNASSGATREYLQGGNLGNGSDAGSSVLSCWYGLGGGTWYCLAAD